MKIVESNILKFSTSDEAIVVKPAAYRVVLNYSKTNGTVDTPRITISLNEIDNYSDYDGDDVFLRFRKSISESRFKIKESNIETKTKNGCTIHIANSFTKSTFQEIVYDFVYFDAIIIINELYCIEFLASFEKVDEQEFTVIYKAVLESLEWNGNEADCANFFKYINNKFTEIENKYSNDIDDINQEFERPVGSFLIPDNGKDIFEIEGITFEIIPNQSLINTASLTKELYVTIVAQTTEVIKGEKIKLLDINEYAEKSEKGLVKIEFPVLEVYENGIPTGSFNFKEDKCENPFSVMQNKGFEYSLDFFGNVTFKNGWVGINGYLKPPYYDEPVFNVKIYKKFNPKTLKWSNYTFKSLEEAMQASKNDVQWLEIQNPTFEILPESIFEFKNLKSLRITEDTWKTKLKLNFISERIGELIHLENIHISRTNIQEIPESIRDLKNLTSLFFSDCSIKKIPNTIMQLPNLLYLTLENNLIETVPENINLPSLYSIDLQGNLLKTLPESLLKQPKINSINLENNPLENLPKEYNDFQELKLSIDDKTRLLDYKYRGAGDNGVVLWNNEIYFCTEEDKLLADLKNVISENKLQKYEKALQFLAKKTIGFLNTNKEDYSQVGNHRFGGKPDLPLNVVYPTFIDNYEGKRICKHEFIGQINCELIADLQDYLPKKGVLFFFLETIHNIYNKNGNPCKVIYISDIETLASGQRFEFVEGEFYDMYQLYDSFKVNAILQLSAPGFYSIYTNNYLFNDKTASLKEIDDYYDVLYHKFEVPIDSKYPHNYAVNSYGFTQHESPELQASLQLKGKPEDWTILLKVTSCGNMQWGDAGVLFFVIHKSDLAKCDFSNVFVTIES